MRTYPIKLVSPHSYVMVFDDQEYDSYTQKGWVDINAKENEKEIIPAFAGVTEAATNNSYSASPPVQERTNEFYRGRGRPRKY